MAPEQRRLIVARREDCPTVKTVARPQGEQVLDLLRLGAGRPGEPALAVAGGRRVYPLVSPQREPLPSEDPHRDAVPPEAPGDAELDLVIPAEDERPALRSRASWRSHPPPSAYATARLARMDHISACAANDVPATKRISGPKFHAAGAPRKWSPGTEDSRPAVSSG